MKARILTLFMALFAFAWSANADEITSMKLTISHNGGEFFEVPFPAEGWPDLDLTDESSSSIRIKRIEVQTSGTVSNVVFKATMYKTEHGLQPDDDWRTFELPQQGNTWVLDFGDEAPDLIDSEMRPSPRTFQFFVQAQDGSGNDIYYNNGGLDYKVLFVKGEASLPIQNLKLTIRLNGGEAFTEELPAEGFPVVDLTDEQTMSLIIEKVEVQTITSVSDVYFLGTMYSTNGGSSGDEWREFEMENKSNGRWMLYFGEGVELVEEDWIGQNKMKTFEFYVKAKDDSGNDIYYNNGGEDYKVIFTTSEGGNSKIQFLKENTAELDLRFNGESYPFLFDDKGNRTPEDQLGQISSLVIDQYFVLFKCENGVNADDVSLQYRVYEEGQEPEGGWNRIDAQQYLNQGDNIKYCYATELNWDVTNGLEPGKNYVLEANYQVVADGEYFFLAKGKEGSKFRFFLTENTSQEEIYSVILTLQHNNSEIEQVYFDHENQPALNYEGQTTSLKIMKVEVWTSEGMQQVAVSGTMYNTENGGPSGSDEWRTMPLTQSDNGYWLLDFGKQGYEIVEDEWLNNNKSKTFQFYVKGQDGSGNDIIYNNAGEDYKVSFTTGSSGGGSGIKSFKLTVSCDGETFTESFPSEGWSQHFIEGLTSSIKIIRAEVETDESLTYLGFCWTIYDTADGWQHDDSAWEWNGFENRGSGLWVLDWGKGREVIESEWLTESKSKTLEFFVDGGDADGNKFQYANGMGDYGYNNNYKVTFTTGPDDDAISLIPASQTNGVTYNLSGQRVGKDYKGIVISNGKKILK